MEDKQEKTFFGQPHGLSTLFFTEMWERFSYYGMRAILLFYMYFALDKGGLGFDKTTAMSVMAIYGSMVYLASVVGGWLSDRIWGSFKTVFIGGVLIMLGHIALAMPMGAAALFISIALIVAGTGLLKPNVSEMVGSLYSEDDRRRDAGFSMFVFGINLGSFIAPIIVGAVGQKINFHLGFSLAAVGMFFGLIQYYRGRSQFSKGNSKPTDPIAADELSSVIRRIIIGLIAVVIIVAAMQFTGNLNIDNIVLIISIVAIALPIIYFYRMLASKKVTKKERSRVLAYIPLFIAAAVFWGIEESGSVVLALFAEDRTVLHIGHMSLAASSFQSLNPLFIMLLTPLFVWLWSTWKKQPSAPGKFAVGLIFAGLSYMFMALPGLLNGTTGRVSPFWLIGSWFIVEIAEMLISPIGLSITTKLAPKAFQAQMMSMWFLADAAGQAVNAQLVRLYSPQTEIRYFLGIGIVSAIFGIILIFFVKPIHKLMEGVN
ncbi:peptide MFS transporter [Latilactobacillus graminis]|uniref:Di-/tripeptide transporter n=2 Tax=Latilactobacillus graminis TaxID=60519 RepID=A0AA89HZR0_9LACO|nr:peptide MFS transporter [Latilactobacillus graminis]KRM20947.1 di- tripeptide transporter [Latilactobacillus graminis DSM 20719]QFP79088.1 peptide MFS transporter [Latilactobacillus graminis]